MATIVRPLSAPPRRGYQPLRDASGRFLPASCCIHCHAPLNYCFDRWVDLGTGKACLPGSGGHLPNLEGWGWTA